MVAPPQQLLLINGREPTIYHDGAPGCPYYKYVPKGYVENLEWRRKCTEWAAADVENQRTLWIACARDPLFYTNTFIWAYDPRDDKDDTTHLKLSVVPFNTYPFQDEVLSSMKECLCKEDMALYKSRDMGASWKCLIMIDWLWRFYSMKSSLLVSRVEDLVDKKNDPDCLFWKLDFIETNLPGWLSPKIDRQKLSKANKDNGSTITGSSTTSETSRGGRKSVILFDEFAAVDDGYAMLSASRDNTNCRIFNSTPKGMGNAFAELIHKKKIRQFRLHWSQHPVKAKGLYTTEAGSVKIIDENYEFPPDYPFILDGKQRSPWYDLQCERAAHVMEIAQELDIDFLGSDYQYFASELIEKIRREDVRVPWATGVLEYDSETMEPLGFADQDGGPLNLWLAMDARGMPPSDRSYLIGIDVSAGTGASNSVLSVADMTAREKVAEFATCNMSPDEFGVLAVAVARFFKGNDDEGAFLIWEANGPGRELEKVVLESGYRNIYYRPKQEKSVSKKRSNMPGWWSTKDSKRALLGAYRSALKSGKVVQRSEMAVQEMALYVWTPTQQVAHVGSFKGQDPTGANDNHGDRVLADALMTKALGEWHTTREEGEVHVPVASFAGRRQAYERQRKADSMW